MLRWASVTPWLVANGCSVCLYYHDYQCHTYILIKVTYKLSVLTFLLHSYYMCVNYVSDHPLPSPPNRWWHTTSDVIENMNW